MKPIPRGIPIDIVVVDDHPVARFALKTLLEQQPDWRVSRQFSGPREVIDHLRRHEPRVLIVDLLYADDSGLDLLEHVRSFHPRVRTLVYSMRSQQHYAARCERAGAMAYVSKEEPLETLVEAIRMSLAGKCYSGDGADEDDAPCAGPEAQASGLPRNPPAPDQDITLLSNRELETLHYIGLGHGTQQIAKTMCRTVKTVETYRWRIRKKLGLGSSLELAQYAVLHVQQIAPTVNAQ